MQLSAACMPHLSHRHWFREAVRGVRPRVYQDVQITSQPHLHSASEKQQHVDWYRRLGAMADAVVPPGKAQASAEQGTDDIDEHSRSRNKLLRAVGEVTWVRILPLNRARGTLAA